MSVDRRSFLKSITAALGAAGLSLSWFTSGGSAKPEPAPIPEPEPIQELPRKREFKAPEYDSRVQGCVFASGFYPWLFCYTLIDKRESGVQFSPYVIRDPDTGRLCLFGLADVQDPKKIDYMRKVFLPRKQDGVIEVGFRQMPEGAEPYDRMKHGMYHTALIERAVRSRELYQNPLWDYRRGA